MYTLGNLPFQRDHYIKSAFLSCIIDTRWGVKIRLRQLKDDSLTAVDTATVRASWITAITLSMLWIQGCRGYGDSHKYRCGMGMGTMMNPHGSVRLNLICTCWIMMFMHHAVQYWVHTMILYIQMTYMTKNSMIYASNKNTQRVEYYNEMGLRFSKFWGISSRYGSPHKLA